MPLMNDEVGLGSPEGLGPTGFPVLEICCDKVSSRFLCSATLSPSGTQGSDIVEGWLPQPE
jgi:hypothetical protein